ncbi:maleylpyruvate isomerase family mycothiol-dependent enzyme [Streptomyces novaecaesareae]|uniref:maleylpyruvate isomerase family mycothiol-dependent enzyme n=1 Tax=Streptomyces novaecaesareae TaxID=68244 RepID=UPI000527AC1B|nr:maleylpyruvate isomerase family mycothiol-dependent enzyme [Streptomyces novaecaesareae]
MTPNEHVAAVSTETARFVAAVRAADPAVPVPSCPGWTLADLVRHAGSVQRWFTVLLQRRSQEPPTSRDVELKLPERAEDYPAWLAEAAAEADATFADGDLDAPMWAWGVDQHARFWVRRMLFETLVHRVDAELALGLEPGIDPVLAADGVDEFLTNLPYAAIFAPRTAELRGDDRTIRFTRTDGDGQWLVRLRPDGFGLEPGDAPADATVSATAADLLLLLYGRTDRTAAEITTAGDEQLLELWFANSAF